MRRILIATALLAFASQAAELTGGTGKLYIGGRPGQILIIDEATEKVIGEIKTKTGVPDGLEISDDKKRFYYMNTMFEDVEIADIATRQVIDTFRLSEGNKKVRIRSYDADPTNSYMILLTKTASKLPDRWEIGPPTLQQYDLKTHKVMRTIPWPKGEEREFAVIKFSPDGKLMYMFGPDIVIYDTKDFKEVDKWEISRPLEDGFGRINFGALDDSNEEPGFLTGLFTVQDPVAARRIMGIARVNLPQKSVDFYGLGPAIGVGFTMAPDRKFGYGLHSEVGRYEFWSFDLANRKLDRRMEFQGRPRMSLKTSSNGKVLYIYNAGNTIDLYDAATFRYMRTITLDTDTTTGLYVLP
jgi:hypothetical protein